MRGLLWALGLALVFGLVPAAVTNAEAPATMLEARAATFVLAPPVLFSTSAKRGGRLHLSCGAQTEPCFGLALRPPLRLPAAAVRNARAESVEPHASARTTQRSLTALPQNKAFGVGKRIALGSGRELSLQLTPTPARCAPLLQLTY